MKRRPRKPPARKDEQVTVTLGLETFMVMSMLYDQLRKGQLYDDEGERIP